MEIHRKYVIEELYDYLNSHRNAYMIAFDIKGLMPINDISRKAGDIAIRASLQRIEEAAEEDILYDEIGAHLVIKRMRSEHRDLFMQLEQYYRTFFLDQSEE